MTRRTLLIAANWKMNPAPAGFDAADSPFRKDGDIDVFVFPASLDIAKCVSAGIITGGQCGRRESSGAFTGDVSMTMLKAAGCASVLCGHSERRKFHGETDQAVGEQVKAAIDAGLTPIACVGETLSEREEGKTFDVVKKQISSLPPEISIIAYEPVWAIGTGKSATAAQAQEVHAYIRTLLKNPCRIIYGGSLNVANAKELLSQPDIDGGLIGGASLKIEEFHSIVNTARTLK